MRCTEKGDAGSGFKLLSEDPSRSTFRGAGILDGRDGREWEIERVVIGTVSLDRSVVALQRGMI